MVFSYDASQPPVDEQSWQEFLLAVESAHQHDEDEWLEFKGPLDLDGRPARAKLAKAIVAFANRDPRLAARRFRGQAFIVAGVEPGRVTGVTGLDPAQLHDRVDPYISRPSPHWEGIALEYRGCRVLVVLVSPPQEGDPVYCIAKSGDEVIDGQVFVRRQGKSEPAGSTDLQRLFARSQANLQPSLDIEVAVTPTESQSFKRVTWDSAWQQTWVEAERDYLLAPMMKDLHTPPGPQDPFGVLGLAKAQNTALMLFKDPESRSEETYRAQVERHLEQCVEILPHAPLRAAANYLPHMRCVATNRTPHNLTAVQVVLTFSGPVAVTLARDDLFAVRHGLPKQPRLWGPVDKHQLRPLLHDVDQSWLHPQPEIEQVQRLVLRPTDLRPGDEFTVLDADHVLVLTTDHTGPVSVHWSATATNVSGRVEGNIDLALEDDAEDLTTALQHRVGDDLIVFRGGEMLRGDEL